MKLNGIFGTGSGKTGNAVFATSAGKQIVRTYQPKVTNPNTDAQIAQRAKFKLLSQLAAAMAPVIVIPKKELVSARNRFVQMNFNLATFEDNQAKVNLSSIKLTTSQKTLPGINLTPGEGGTEIVAALNTSVFGLFEKVRYAVFKQTNDDKLQLVAQKVVEVNETTSPTASTNFSGLNQGDYVVYAYGMNAKNSSATVGYGNYMVESVDENVVLESSLRISTYNYDFSVTQGDSISLS